MFFSTNYIVGHIAKNTKYRLKKSAEGENNKNKRKENSP